MCLLSHGEQGPASGASSGGSWHPETHTGGWQGLTRSTLSADSACFVEHNLNTGELVEFRATGLCCGLWRLWNSHLLSIWSIEAADYLNDIVRSWREDWFWEDHRRPFESGIKSKAGCRQLPALFRWPWLPGALIANAVLPGWTAHSEKLSAATIEHGHGQDLLWSHSSKPPCYDF